MMSAAMRNTGRPGAAMPSITPLQLAAAASPRRAQEAMRQQIAQAVLLPRPLPRAAHPLNHAEFWIAAISSGTPGRMSLRLQIGASSRLA